MRHSFAPSFQTEKKNRRKSQARRRLSAALARPGAAEAAAPCGQMAGWQHSGLAALKSGALKSGNLPSGAPAGSRNGGGERGAGKKRRGRPRLEGRLREPNGRIARAQKPAALQALQARARHAGLTLAQARDPRAETYLGRLAIFGRGDGLSRDQYEAAQNFLALRNDYRRSLLSPGAYYEATGIRLGEDNMAEYTAWAGRVKKRYNGALKAIQEAQLDNGRENIYAALQYVIIDGLELPYLLGAVRLALNALHRHFSRSGEKAAAKSGSWADKHMISLAGLGLSRRLN